MRCKCICTAVQRLLCGCTESYEYLYTSAIPAALAFNRKQMAGVQSLAALARRTAGIVRQAVLDFQLVLVTSVPVTGAVTASSVIGGWFTSHWHCC
ncbi:hypothetical protein ACOMHN_032669 [Nucella lapillus]